MAKHTPNAQFVRVTPKRAAELLAANTHNRGMNASQVSTLAREMSNGEWIINGETVKVAHDGSLIDGQHRLAAIVQSGVPSNLLLVEGLSTDHNVQYTTDVGMKRSLNHTLALLGEKSTASLASALRVLWRFRKGLMLTNQQPAFSEALHLLEQHPGIRDAVTQAGHSKSDFRASTVSWCIYTTKTIAEFDDEISTEDVDVFWQRLQTGLFDQSVEGDPIVALRNKVALARKSPMMRITSQASAALTVKTWNSYIDGTPVKLLTWRRGGANPMGFPVLRGQETLAMLGWFD